MRRGIQAIHVVGGGPTEVVDIDPPLLTALMPAGARQKQRRVPLTQIPKRMQQAVLAIEDQSFYSHPGINPFRLMSVAFQSLIGGAIQGGASTITQQLSRMFFLADEFNAELQSGERGRSLESYVRKAREGVMSLVLERRASKDEILELYLNDVYLGQRGSFAIHGVAEAARIFYGKDVSNITVAEAALIAGLIQSPASRSPFTNPKRAVERRNTVIRAMASEDFISAGDAETAINEPLLVAARSVDNEAPYFVDMVSQEVATSFPRVTDANRVDVHTTLDLNLQKAALDAVRAGLAEGGRGTGQAPQEESWTRAGCARRGGPAHRRDSGHGRRAVLQPVTVQPRGRLAAPAGLGLQAVRVPGGVRARGAHRRAGSDGRLAHAGRAGAIRRERRSVGAAELRRLRRRDHVAARAGHVAQPRHDSRRRAHRVRHGRRTCGARSAWASRRTATRRSRSACSS